MKPPGPPVLAARALGACVTGPARSAITVWRGPIS